MSPRMRLHHHTHPGAQPAVVVAVAIGGAAGAAARYGAERSWPTGTSAFPWTVLLVNTVGCFLLAGGLAGAPLRYLLGVDAKFRLHSTFPWGTFAADAGAALLLGFFSEAVTDGSWVSGSNCCSPPASAAPCRPGRRSPTSC